MLPEADDQVRTTLHSFFVGRTEESFCALFALMFPKLKRYLLLSGGVPEVVEQLAIDSLFTVYTRIDDVRDPASFTGWIYRIARNELLQHLRRTKTESSMSSLDHSTLETQKATAYLDGFAQSLELRDWLACLDLQSCQIMLLRYVEGLEYHEIADALAMPIGTVKWKISDSKTKLARSLHAPQRI